MPLLTRAANLLVALGVVSVRAGVALEGEGPAGEEAEGAGVAALDRIAALVAGTDNHLQDSGKHCTGTNGRHVGGVLYVSLVTTYRRTLSLYSLSSAKAFYDSML